MPQSNSSKSDDTRESGGRRKKARSGSRSKERDESEEPRGGSRSARTSKGGQERRDTPVRRPEKTKDRVKKLTMEKLPFLDMNIEWKDGEMKFFWKGVYF